MAAELGHHRLAEAHDLALGAALRVEIGAALAAADGHAGQRVLEGLLEAEKLDGAEKDAGMKPQAALERAERGVELNAEAAVDLHPPPVVHPRHAEDDLPLGLADALDQRAFGIVGVLGDDRAEAVKHLAHGLVEFLLSRIAAQHVRENRFQLFIEHRSIVPRLCFFPYAEQAGSARLQVERRGTMSDPGAPSGACL